MYGTIEINGRFLIEQRDSIAASPIDLGKLHSEIAHELQAYITGIVHDPDIAGELVQDAFARLVERPAPSDLRSAKAWAYRVAHNVAIDWCRSKRRERKHVGQAWWLRPRETEDEGIDCLLKAEQKVRIRQAIDRLPAEQRFVVERRIFQGRKFAVIAEELGVPLGTVLTRMRLAMVKLSRSLSDEKNP
ncbi:RNA polymerase sigma factor [Stratiformator vulcanicus]|uniref:RNA polymerase sigma factor n=1 Tax=Stratiformator vulcanicus TaxID=2527980 RepID=UPI002877ACD7|nr:RNA polymerase sigma factor [Stratiformator vulcanicus]